MDIKDGHIYSITQLQNHLKAQGLPFSRATIINYERKGLLPSPRLRFGNHDRAYSFEDIEEITTILKDRKYPKRVLTK